MTRNKAPARWPPDTYVAFEQRLAKDVDRGAVADAGERHHVVFVGDQVDGRDGDVDWVVLGAEECDLQPVRRVDTHQRLGDKVTLWLPPRRTSADLAEAWSVDRASNGQWCHRAGVR